MPSKDIHLELNIESENVVFPDHVQTGTIRDEDGESLIAVRILAGGEVLVLALDHELASLLSFSLARQVTKVEPVQ